MTENDLYKYNKKYKEQLKSKLNQLDKNNLKVYINKPYDYFNYALIKLSKKYDYILELASGSGTYSMQYPKLFREVILSDLAPYSLLILKRKFKKFENVHIKKLDIESIDLPSKSQELICMIGSISYGDNSKIISEIYRILKKNGTLLIIDSPNTNIIFYLYRLFLLFFKKDKRSLKTFKNLYSKKTINIFQESFKIKEIRYFGHLLPLAFLISFLPKNFSNKLLERLIKFEEALKYNTNGYKVFLELEK